MQRLLEMAVLATTLVLLGALASPAAAAGFQQVSPGVHSMPVHKTRKLAFDHTALQGNDYPTGGSIWPVGIFWVEIEVGTPPVKFPVAIDSGSGDLDIEGSACVACNKSPPNAGYDKSKSSTSKAVFPYGFSNSYQTCDLTDITAVCTISGGLYEDQVGIGGLGPVSVHLGAIEKITSNFDQFAHICGVMGFIGTDNKNVFSQLVAAGSVKDDLFSLCINEEGKTSNGTLTLGGIDERLQAGPMQWVPNSGSGFYEVALDGILAGNISLKGLNPSAILDTGTNILLFPDAAFNSIKAAFGQMCQQGASLHGSCDVESGSTLFDRKCYQLTDAEIAAYPPLTFQLKGVTLTMHPQDYLLRGDVRAVKQGDASLTCLGIRATGSSNFLIIGDSLMRNYVLAFDRGQDRIGWAPVNKTACGNV